MVVWLGNIEAGTRLAYSTGHIFIFCFENRVRLSGRILQVGLLSSVLQATRKSSLLTCYNHGFCERE